jgi:hypothetical protein
LNCLHTMWCRYECETDLTLFSTNSNSNRRLRHWFPLTAGGSWRTSEVSWWWRDGSSLSFYTCCQFNRHPT